MVERSHLAPFLYYVQLDVDPKKGDPFLKWLSGKHIQDVLRAPGFMWARRVPLDEPAEDGWKRLLIVYPGARMVSLSFHMAEPEGAVWVDGVSLVCEGKELLENGDLEEK